MFSFLHCVSSGGYLMYQDPKGTEGLGETHAIIYPEVKVQNQQTEAVALSDLQSFLIGRGIDESIASKKVKELEFSSGLNFKVHRFQMQDQLFNETFEDVDYQELVPGFRCIANIEVYRPSTFTVVLVRIVKSDNITSQVTMTNLVTEGRERVVKRFECITPYKKKYCDTDAFENFEYFDAMETKLPLLSGEDVEAFYNDHLQVAKPYISSETSKIVN